MEPNFDELTHIGMEFTLPRVQNRQATKEEIKKLREDINNDIKKNEEEMISIVVKPDPAYPNPDTTGNGIAEGMEFYDFSVEEAIINGFNDEKYQKEIIRIVNNINNYIIYCQRQFNEIESTLDLKDKEVAQTIFNKVVKNFKSNIKTHYLYTSTGDRIVGFVDICNNIINAINILDLKKFDTYIKFFEEFKPTWLFTRDTYYYLNSKDMNSFFTSLNNYDYAFIKAKLENHIGLIKNEKNIPLISVIANPDNILGNWKNCNHSIYKNLTPIKVKSTDGIPNVEYACILIQFIYIFFSAFFTTVLDVSEDIVSIIQKIDPVGLNKSYKSCLIENLEDKDPWICCDYHLLKELKHGTTDTSRTQKLIKMHNSLIKPNDLVLFLGDITESEYFDQNNIKIIKQVSYLTKKLNGHMVMIIGNNDTGPIDMYLKMGFEEVYDKPILGKKYLFSHEPQIMDNYPKDILNIHGHIHGSKKYYDMDTERHLDAYYGLYGKPMRLSELVKYYNSGKYDELEGNIKGWRDPRISLTPIKI